MNPANENQPMLTQAATAQGEAGIERVCTRILADFATGRIPAAYIPAHQVEMGIALARLEALRADEAGRMRTARPWV